MLAFLPPARSVPRGPGLTSQPHKAEDGLSSHEKDLGVLNGLPPHYSPTTQGAGPQSPSAISAASAQAQGPTQGAPTVWLPFRPPSIQSHRDSTLTELGAEKTFFFPEKLLFFFIRHEVSSSSSRLLFPLAVLTHLRAGLRSEHSCCLQPGWWRRAPTLFCAGPS